MINCPRCNTTEDTLEVLVDAYVVYTFRGFDDAGHITAANFDTPAIRTDEFDDHKVVCSACGEEINWTDFLPADSNVLTADDSHLVIKFGDSDDRLRRGIARTLSHMLVKIEYNEGVNPDFPTSAVIMRGDDNSLDICVAKDGGPLRDQTYGVHYHEIKTITVL